MLVRCEPGKMRNRPGGPAPARSPRGPVGSDGGFRLRSSGLMAGILVAVTLASCAGPTELARQSEQQLQAGDLRKAYELARDAVQKDATNERARAAYQAAAARYYDDTRRRFGIVAEVDTLAAAHYAIDLAALHGEMIQYRAGVAQNPAF